jgi:hypothetical protein
LDTGSGWGRLNKVVGFVDDFCLIKLQWYWLLYIIVC